MPASWTEVLDALEQEVHRLAAVLERGPHEHDVMRDVVGEHAELELPTTPLPAELRERAAELELDMARMTTIMEQHMLTVHSHLSSIHLHEEPHPPVFLDVRY
jgi:hypothetical protein